MKKIFYSWQSDLPNTNNRNFIGSCLEKAIKILHKEHKIECELDQDTRGTAGSPYIFPTIIQKISECSVFVADISIINQLCKCLNSEGEQIKKSPNPNVLIELGYALGKHGWGKVICIYNEDFGGKDELPFNLGLNRIMFYSVEGKDKSKAKSELINDLTKAIKIILENETTESTNEKNESFDVTAVENFTYEKANYKVPKDFLEYFLKPHWEIIIRPLKYNGKNLELSERKSKVSSSVVPIRGGFPEVDNPEQKENRRGNFFETWCIIDEEQIYWRMHRSGQFIYYRNIEEDLWNQPNVIQEKKLIRNLKPSIELQGFLDIYVTMNFFTSIYNFAANLAKNIEFYDNVLIEIELVGCQEYALFMLDYKIRFREFCCFQDSNSNISLSHTYKINELINNPNSIAVTTSKEFFEKFNWENATQEFIEKIQSKET